MPGEQGASAFNLQSFERSMFRLALLSSAVGIAPCCFDLRNGNCRSASKCRRSCFDDRRLLASNPWHHLRYRDRVKQRHNRIARVLQRESKKAGLHSLHQVSGLCDDHLTAQFEVSSTGAGRNGHELIDIYVTVTNHAPNPHHPS